MNTHMHANRRPSRSSTTLLSLLILVAPCIGVSHARAQTYISAEPIPSEQIVGTANLTKILGLGYPKLELWSDRLLWQCHLVQEIIWALADEGAITTITPSNTDYAVAAGGFEGVTDPSYVFRIANSASAADIFVLDNALGYVLNQSGTAQFSLTYDPNNPYVFPLAYAIVKFDEHLTGERAERFFDYLGTIDAALWNGANAGFTQIDLPRSREYNAMLFLIGDVSTQEFTQGIYKAASTTDNARYFPLDKYGQPTTGTAGVAFPGNDWSSSPNGEGYLVNLVNASPELLKQLANLRKKHLDAVAGLLDAINRGDVDQYLWHGFRCPCTGTAHENAQTEPKANQPGSRSQSHLRRHRFSPHL
jgi:hypothetical protein